MHRKLQTMAAAMEESRRNGAPESASVQPPSEEFAPMARLQSLEEAVLRLDALAKQQEATIEVLRNRPTDPMPRLLAAAAAVLSVAALLIAIMQ
jgi:hypothetical protein